MQERAARSGCSTIGRGDVVVSGGSPVAIWAADCVMVVLASRSGMLVAVHAGWQGLAAGVLDVAIDAAGGARAIAAVVVGPLIRPECYEFGSDDLVRVASGVHASPDDIRATSAAGTPALDVPAALAAAFAHHGVSIDADVPCTGCDDRWYSHRVRGDRGRHAMIGWWS